MASYNQKRVLSVKYIWFISDDTLVYKSFSNVFDNYQLSFQLNRWTILKSTLYIIKIDLRNFFVAESKPPTTYTHTQKAKAGSKVVHLNRSLIAGRAWCTVPRHGHDLKLDQLTRRGCRPLPARPIPSHSVPPIRPLSSYLCPPFVRFRLPHLPLSIHRSPHGNKGHPRGGNFPNDRPISSRTKTPWTN